MHENEEKGCIAHFTGMSECGIYKLQYASKNKIEYSDQQSIFTVSPESKVKKKKISKLRSSVLLISKLDDKIH